MFDRYSLKSLRRALKNPSKIKRETKILASFLSLAFQKAQFRRKYGSGDIVVERDWDFLIILDACRYDTFSEVNWIDGELEYMISKGSHSEEFSEANFNGRELYDTVYTTANAHGARIAQNDFHDIIFTEKANGDVNWASRDGMHPEVVCELAQSSVDEYPNKRHIIHFMQPHNPYFGEKASNLRKRLAQDGVNDLGASYWDTGPDLGLAVQNGLISLSEYEEIYRENLEYVLEYVDKLCNEFDGKIVITADHGELLGCQDGLWKFSDLKRQTPNGEPVDHPKNVYLPELRKVPYLIIEAENRPFIEAENPKECTTIKDEELENRLKALGYK